MPRRQDLTPEPDERTVKALQDDEAPSVANRQIWSDQATEVPAHCVVLHMMVLENPEPIRRPRKKRALRNRELLSMARKHQPPPEWWNAADDPFGAARE